MTKQEFEGMTIRSNGGTISNTLYSQIELSYMFPSNNQTKQEFCQSIFGGKTNTAKTILEKWIAHVQAENRKALYCESKARLDEMDACISEHYTFSAKAI